MNRKSIEISVGELLSFYAQPWAGRGGIFLSMRGVEGTHGHGLISRQDRGYVKEVPVEFHVDYEEYRLLVRGRMDWLLDTKHVLVVEEIKTTYASLPEISPVPVHEAQLKLYMYFLMARRPGAKVEGRLTYLNLEDLSEKSFSYELTLEEGENLFFELAGALLARLRDQENWREVRNRSLSALRFPFSDTRPGQDELMEAVTLALRNERDLFVEAATGIGKTIAVLFPVLKQMAVEDAAFSQVFFLTAKTAGRKIVADTLKSLREEGMRLRVVFIEAKERVCLSPGTECQPAECPYLSDYVKKLRRIIPRLFAHETVNADIIRGYAEEEQVCPFELSLDYALGADLIVCDYNYVFDPAVCFRRFFSGSGRRDFVFLVDEAHNLVARGREMYSASLSEEDLARVDRAVRTIDPGLDNACRGVEIFFHEWRSLIRQEEQAALKISRLPEAMYPALERLLAAVERFLRSYPRGEVWLKIRDFYYILSAFTRVAAWAGREYAIYIKIEKKALIVRLYCVNPGPLLKNCLEHSRATIFFSATLSPFYYFRELLGGGRDAVNIVLASPFPAENRLYLHVPGINTKYRLRRDSAELLARCAVDMIMAHSGNYLMFFPSYAYLQAIYPLLKILLDGKAEIHVQNPGMTERQKHDFLQNVASRRTKLSNLGLAVLGGLFGEGVDLPGEQLVGVMIVGPGLPAVSEEQELIREYFDERSGQGYLFAYVIPGLIKVIQAAGRVFRSPEDRGVVILVDDRLAQENYMELLPPDWFRPGRSFSDPGYKEALEKFWQNNAGS